jgi:hypothetical protein
MDLELEVGNAFPTERSFTREAWPENSAKEERFAKTLSQAG